MQNKIFIPNLGSKKLMINKEIDEIRGLLDKLEKEIHGHPINEACTKLIKKTLGMASASLRSCLTYKKFSNESKRQ